jgi:hypothetical protein
MATTSAWWDEAVDHGFCDDVVSEDFAPAADGLVVVRQRRLLDLVDGCAARGRGPGLAQHGGRGGVLGIDDRLVVCPKDRAGAGSLGWPATRRTGRWSRPQR